MRIIINITKTFHEVARLIGQLSSVDRNVQISAFTSIKTLCEMLAEQAEREEILNELLDEQLHDVVTYAAQAVGINTHGNESCGASDSALDALNEFIKEYLRNKDRASAND